MCAGEILHEQGGVPGQSPLEAGGDEESVRPVLTEGDIDNTNSCDFTLLQLVSDKKFCKAS